ncbi:MAG: hypothetical protein NPIRA02_16450 [Nitrospirales bacterium]|nr:MAG: hypothetical protein NPIRA02_16450 [Nitrospirales bacterium]
MTFTQPLSFRGNDNLTKFEIQIMYLQNFNIVVPIREGEKTVRWCQIDAADVTQAGIVQV